MPMQSSEEATITTHTHTHTHPFNGPLYGTTWTSRYQKGKTNLDFTEARDSEWQWHQLGHMQVCNLLQTTTPAPHHYRLTWVKGSPYSITEHRVLELILVHSSQSAGDVSHKPGGRLPLLSTRHAVNPATLKRAATNFAAW